jgi:hypothetical protein
LSHDFSVLLELLGAAAGVCLVVTGVVYTATARRAKRYRPGRPFEFAPVWFVSAPKAADGGSTPGRELTVGGTLPVIRRNETGGTSDSW